jgi:hypothetical protein
MKLCAASSCSDSTMFLQLVLLITPVAADFNPFNEASFGNQTALSPSCAASLNQTIL